MDGSHQPPLFDVSPQDSPKLERQRLTDARDAAILELGRAYEAAQSAVWASTRVDEVESGQRVRDALAAYAAAQHALSTIKGKSMVGSAGEGQTRRRRTAPNKARGAAPETLVGTGGDR